MIKKYRSLVGCLIFAIFLVLGGCSSATVKLSPMPPEKYEVLGKASGKSCGYLTFWIAGTSFIPIRLSSRIERATEDALSKHPGATGLINVSITEFWFFWYMVHGQCIAISGEAIKS